MKIKHKKRYFAQNAFVFVMTLMGGLSAHADDTEIFFGGVTDSSVQPNILFILDTSGSMSYYDGTSQMRIDRMKEALRSIIGSVNNVNIGLMRFNAPGGPVLYPVTDIDATLSSSGSSTSYSGSASGKPTASSDDAEESSSGNVILDNNEATLTILNLGGGSGGSGALSVKINKGTDDAEESDYYGSVYTGKSILHMPRDDRINRRRNRQYQHIGLRFENITIPRGATIDSATMDFEISAIDHNREVSMGIFGELVDSGTFISSNRNISNRTTTSSVIPWNLPGNSPPIGDTLTSVDFKGVVQEIVDQGSWSSGDAMTIIMNRANGRGDRVVTSFEGDPADAPTLNITYSGGSSGTPDNQTVGIRFTDIDIPQGAKITSAVIDFTASTSSSNTAQYTIRGEDTDSASTYNSTSRDISGRTYTSASATWTPADWTSSGSVYSSGDLTAIVQEIVDRSGWCGGNAMAFAFTGNAFNLGNRIFDTFDKGATGAPELKVTYDPASIPSGGGCMSTEINKQIAQDADDAEQDGRSMNLTSTDLDFAEQTIGLRFQDIPLPQGAKIQSAYLELTADANDTSSVITVIHGEDSDNSLLFTSSRNDISNRAKTSASTSWTMPSWNSNASYRSPDITNIVQEIVNRSGWDVGHAMAFIISDNGTSGSNNRNAKTFDDNPANSARLIIKAAGVDPTLGEDTTRDALIELIDNFKPSGSTPIVDTLYEAALYYRGDDVYYGKTRGSSSTIPDSYRRYFRVSDDSTYTGGTRQTPSSCSESDYDSSRCINEYISGSPKYISPITDVCQSNHIVLLTDGEPTVNESKGLIRTMTGDSSCKAVVNSSGSRMDGDGDCAIELASFLQGSDQSTSLVNDQKITTHTIGFNFDDVFLQDIADAGAGSYKTASSASELVDNFNEILRDILQTDTTFVSPGVTVNSFNKLTHRNEIYYALFRPEEKPRWPGNLKRYKLKPDGTIVDQNDVSAIDPTTGFLKDTARSFWSNNDDGNDVTKGGAAHELPNYATRKVYTHYAGSSSTTLSNAVNALSYSNRSNITKALLGIETESDSYHENLLNWARGKDVLDADGDNNKSENRDQLSDPLHSIPHLVTYGGTDANPDITIFYGDNEGFIHAIDADDGSEIFSFIPEELLDNLNDLYVNSGENRHIYGMDGPVTSWVYDADGDAQIEPSDDHVYVYFGMRRGGSSYYALDVTDRNNPKVLWTITGGSGDFSELAQTWSKPIKTKVNINNTTHDVLIFAGGYDADQDDVTVRTTDDEGRAIFMVDAATGKLIWKAGSNRTDDLELSDMKYSIPSDIRAIDVNADGLADQLYVGDMGGQLWRVDFHHGETLKNFATAAVIANLGGATAADTRRFYHEPDLSVMVEGGVRKLAIAIGSGYRAHPLSTDNEDRFYLIKQDDITSAPEDDNGDGQPDYVTLTESDLYDATDNLIKEGTSAQIETAVRDLAAADGWYIKMENKGEKVLSGALTIANEILFTTYEPSASSSTSCVAAAGTPRLYQVNSKDATPTGKQNLGTVDPDSHNRASTLMTIGLPADPVRLRISDSTNNGGSISTETKDVVCVGTECAEFNSAGSIIKTYWYSD